MIRSYRGKLPVFDATVFIAESAEVVGDLEFGSDASVWFGSVIRADVNYVRVGARTNIQDLTVIHVNHGTHPTILDEDVTIGHRAILHGCHVKAGCLIGMGAVVMDGVVVEERSLVGAGALVTPGTHIPSGCLAFGSPARVVRKLKDSELQGLIESSQHYVSLKDEYLVSQRSPN